MIEKILKENKNKSSARRIGGSGIIIFLTIFILGLPLSVSTAYIFAFRERVYPKISVCQTDLTGQNKEEVIVTLSSLLKKNYPSHILLSEGNQNFFLSPKLVKYLPDNTAERSLKLGREKLLPLNLKSLIKLLSKGENLGFDFQVDSEGFDSEIASISAKLYLSPIDPQVKFIKTSKEKKIIVENGKPGREVDIRVLKQEFFNRLACPQEEVILLFPVKTIAASISEETAETMQRRASVFLDKEIKLSLDDQIWTIDDEEVISFLSFDNGFNRLKLENFVQEFAKTINTLPENAALRFDAGQNKVAVFRPSREGIILKEAEFVDLLLNKLLLLETTQKNQEVVLPVAKAPAKVTTGDVNSLGIKELLSRGTSLFQGSISERIHNINLASLRLNGILIPPEESFSFNKSLGDVSQDTGFKQAYIIKEGRTILGDGGGVCQVSTTLFRAALNTGLPITERHAHAYRVHYYEEDLGPGFDATVFDPTFDLKFKNNTSGYILIQSSVDLKRKQLIFELYGTKDNRQIEISKARVWDKQPPPPDLYQDDPTLPVGVTKQIDWKAWGSKAAFDYKVTRNSEIIFEKTFSSVYKPWQAVYLRGTAR